MDATITPLPHSDAYDAGTVEAEARIVRVARKPAELAALAVLLAGLVAVAAPTLVFVARESWSTEQGSHGPIVLFTGLWLLWRQWPEARPLARRPAAWKAGALLVLFLALYAFARITQIVEIEGYFMYATVLAVLYSIIGAAAMKRLWFPLVYIAFIFPPPKSLVAAVTLPMKMELSRAAVGFLSLFGYPIGGKA